MTYQMEKKNVGHNWLQLIELLQASWKMKICTLMWQTLQGQWVALYTLAMFILHLNWL